MNYSGGGGAKLTSDGCDFTVYAPKATSVVLCLYSQHELQNSIELSAYKDGHWFVHVAGIMAGQFYAYRVHGEFTVDNGQIFNSKQLLIDPYAKLLSSTVEHNSTHRTFLSSREEALPNSRPNQLTIPKSVVVDDDFNWNHVKKVRVKPENRIIYEAHINGLTQLNKKVKAARRGKYLGACDPDVIRHFKRLGVTSIQIMPCFSFMTEPHLIDKGLTNYWGYNPVNFFAPDWRYAIDDPVKEFKTMVRTFHEHGFEVILDVVYNHTAEGEIDGPYLCHKGFANTDYYRYDTTEKNYLNYSGCGNTIFTHHPHTRHMIIDSLRYWSEYMHVDGFRFDLATMIGRDDNGFNQHSEMFAIINNDPVLSQSVLIAEPWDMDTYALGGFPEPWLQCNDRFRDDVRMLVRGDQGKLKYFAQRMMGSQDFFRNKALYSVNYVNYHDGFTLHDLVAYEQRWNEANQEQNRDGHSSNFSANYGAEGETDDPEINNIRRRQKRNFISLLFLSAGTPHWSGGDEFNRSQLGNNNAYCQDNAISWLDWTEADNDLVAWVSTLISLRRKFPCFHGLNSSDLGIPSLYTVRWYDVNGKEMNDDDWNDPNLSYTLIEYSSNEGLHSNLLFLINMGGAKQCGFPPHYNSTGSYHVLLNTLDQRPVSSAEAMTSIDSIELPEKSLCLIQTA